MKKSIFLMLVSSILWLCAISQEQGIAGTTQEEYNYCTKGYKDVYENGTDVKSGYSAVPLSSYTATNGARAATVRALYRKGETSPCAIIVILIQKGLDNQYLCIPTTNASSTLWDQYSNAINAAGDYALEVISMALSKAIMK